MISLRENSELQQHTWNLVNIASKFADYIDYEDKMKLLLAAQLHDIGKLWVDKNILNKKTSLTKEEMEEIRKHTYYSYTICKSSVSSEILDAILHHHERVDGKGYPHNLLGDEISTLTKILTLCDSYEAMIGERQYRDPLTKEQAIVEIRKNLGKQFDLELGQKFVSFLRDSFQPYHVFNKNENHINIPLQLEIV